MGVYGTSTFFQGEPVTPSAHTAPPSSMCTTFSTVGAVALSTSASAGTTSPASSATGSHSSGTSSASATGGTQNSAAAPVYAVSALVQVMILVAGVVAGVLVIA